MTTVILLSPYKGDTKKNTKYIRLCIRDSLERGEYPFASHALYTARGILDDTNPAERKWGMDAGYAWMELADKVVAYTDFGVSEGMKKDLYKAVELKKEVEYRRILT